MVSIAPPRSPALDADDETIEQLRQLGELQCPVEEVAVILGRTEASLTTFLNKKPAARGAYLDGRGKGLEALRRSQFKLAQTNATMAIFLGKTYLGQAERREADQSAEFDVARTAERVKARLAALIEAARADEGREMGQ